MPGSAFKPLYYSAAMDSRKWTPASLMYDSPIVFYNEDGTAYIPSNYGGLWRGPILLYKALALSLNIPALQILDSIGFDQAINRSASLLGITDPAVKRATFPRYYPMGLGIISLSPLQLTRAFAIFANEGRDVTPIAIRSVEDRNGAVIMDVERDLRTRQRQMGKDIQVVSSQTAYVMTQLLKGTVTLGTLYGATQGGSKFAYEDKDGKPFRMPVAGKTGTTQNWSDAWSVGYTPYYTTTIWYGFDKPGNSLGMNQTGAALAAPVWADYMRDINKGLPRRDFVRPTTGVVDVLVCGVTGQLATSSCNEGQAVLTFLEGTAPREYCARHGGLRTAGTGLRLDNTLRLDNGLSGGMGGLLADDDILGGLSMPTLDLGSLGLTPSSGTSPSFDAAFPSLSSPPDVLPYAPPTAASPVLPPSALDYNPFEDAAPADALDYNPFMD
jgi:penicillin-binding protein 1A